MGKALKAKGLFATVEFDGTVLRIKRGGPHSAGKGETVIPARQITGVEIVRPNPLLSRKGVFRVDYPGAVARIKLWGRRDNARSENTVEFWSGTRSFEAIRDAIWAST